MFEISGVSHIIAKNLINLGNAWKKLFMLLNFLINLHHAF